MVELMGIMVHEMDTLYHLAREGVCDLSDMQVLDLKPHQLSSQIQEMTT